MTEQKLITKSAELFTTKGFRQVASIPDEHGINSTVFVLDGRDELFMLVSKDYAFRGLASFQLRQVKFAVEKGLTLVFYEDEEQTFTVFLPETVEEAGRVSWGESKRAEVEWRELPMEHGISIDRYLNGEVPGGETGQISLGSFA